MKILKDFFLISLGFFIIFSCFKPAYATSSFGTHMPEERKWAWGLEGNVVMDRNLDDEQGGTNGKRFFVTGSFGIFKWLSFDGKIGIGDVDWERTSGNNDIEYDTNFAGGYGFRVKGFEIKKWGIKNTIGFQHISVHPPSKDQDGVKHEAIIDEWNGTFIVSKDIGKFVPYVGGRYGSLDFIKWVDEHDRKRIQSEKYYGVVTGFDWWINDSTKVNLEGIFLDGEEISLGVTRDF